MGKGTVSQAPASRPSLHETMRPGNSNFGPAPLQAEYIGVKQIRLYLLFQ